MKTETSSQSIMAAVYHAYHRADPCHCHGAAKLSEGEILAVFIKKGVISVADTPHQDALSIENLLAAGAIDYYQERRFKEMGITHLPELRYWNRWQLTHVSNIGNKKADEIERMAARFGVLLADGNPALLEEVKRDRELAADEDRHDRPAARTAGTPEEIRNTCVSELLDFAGVMIRAGASLSRIASNIATPQCDGRKAGRLKNYVTTKQFGAAQVRTIAQPYFDMLDAGKPSRARRQSETETKTTALRLVASA